MSRHSGPVSRSRSTDSEAVRSRTGSSRSAAYPVSRTRATASSRAEYMSQDCCCSAINASAVSLPSIRSDIKVECSARSCASRVESFSATDRGSRATVGVITVMQFSLGF